MAKKHALSDNLTHELTQGSAVIVHHEIISLFKDLKRSPLTSFNWDVSDCTASSSVFFLTKKIHVDRRALIPKSPSVRPIGL